MQWINGTGCLLKPGRICFFEEKDVTVEFEYSLDGIERPNCCLLDG
jgi:hypothetical protein